MKDYCCVDYLLNKNLKLLKKIDTLESIKNGYKYLMNEYIKECDDLRKRNNNLIEIIKSDKKLYKRYKNELGL